MPSEVDAFETKRGWCAVGEDGLRLQGSAFGYLRNLYGGYWQRGSSLQRLTFVGTALGLPLGVVGAVLAGASLPTLAVVVAAYLAFAGYQRVVRGFSADDWIPLAAIEAVRPVRGSTGLTRPRLVVRYRVAGTLRRRYVMLPSRYIPDNEGTLEEAVGLLRERGVPSMEGSCSWCPLVGTDDQLRGPGSRASRPAGPRPVRPAARWRGGRRLGASGPR